MTERKKHWIEANLNLSYSKSHAEILTALLQVQVSHTRHSVFPANKKNFEYHHKHWTTVQFQKYL